ncbi:putative ATP-dependent RNA helicase DBP7 [Geopyxis carbonaria]|nr:putative ATP-dependent RNA helicase DBP7 [Geopyxis carbonaria]
MMSDGGMDLNFNFTSIAEPIKKQSASVKGGRWTQRLKAKRATKGRQQRPITEDETQTPVPAVTDREESHVQSLAKQPLKRGRADDKPPKGPPAGANGTFVSSLWTGNPEANTVPETNPKEVEAQAPSNAPITDGSSTFTSLGLSPILASHLTEKLSLKAPTAIQRSAIPQLLSEDSDAFIQAETGSGKTFTYLLPIVDRIMRISNLSGRSGRQSGLYAIILAPTRELSRQIYSVLQTIIHCKNGPHWIVPGLVIGGEKKKSEKARIRKGMNILVCTPGRLLDHLETTTSLQVDRIRWLVLDEGDRLMELGFEEPITKILEFLNKHMRPNRPQPNDPMPSKRVTILCSATMKTNVQALGEKSLKDALYIKSVKEETEDGQTPEKADQFSAPAQLRQSYIIIPAKLRLVGLNAVLQRTFIRPSANPKVVVFFSCTDSVDFHFEVFSRREHSKSHIEDSKTPAIASAPLLNAKLLVHKLHGSLPQLVRTSTLASFTSAKGPAILFCTDVAARGLDLPNLDLVIQFDPPFSPDDHLHRIGRTARAGREGRAVMFLLPGPEEGYVETVLKKGTQEGQLVQSQHDEVIQKGFGEKEEKRREWEDRATEWHLQVERWVMENPKIKELASKAWGSHIRAYTTHVSEEKSIFNHKSLHYGHLAKSFGLRDSPTSIKVPMSHGGQTGGAVIKSSKGLNGKKRKLTADDIGEVAGEDAMKRMRKMARAMEKKGGMSSEFNIG